MRFCKQPILFITILLSSLRGLAQNTDVAPPPDFVADLENLPVAGQNDTASKKTLLSVGTEKYNISTYRLSKKLQGHALGFGEDVRKLNALIDLKHIQTSRYKVLTLISSLRDEAALLCAKNMDFGPSDPLQHKIGYSWGAKQYKVRIKPPGVGDLCAYKINGLDCSGFIFQLFSSGGVPLPEAQCSADAERRPTFLKRHLAAYFGGAKFDVLDEGELKIDQIQSGDIIYFKNDTGGVYHIGILFVNDLDTVSFYQSFGQPNRNPNSDRICRLNVDDNHGPMISTLTKGFLEKHSHHYACVRIVGLDEK